MIGPDLHTEHAPEHLLAHGRRKVQRAVKGDVRELTRRQRLADAIRKVTRTELMDAFQSKVVERTNALRVVTAKGSENGPEVLEQLLQRPFVSAP